MNLTVTTNKGKRGIFVPDKMDQVSTETYQRLVSVTDRFEAYSIICGIPRGTLERLISPDLELALSNSLTLIKSDQSFKDKPIPKRLIIEDVEVKITQKIEGLSIGQSIHVREHLEKCKFYEEAISLAVAIYLQPNYDNLPFDLDQALELEEDILKLPITETYPIGFFLLSLMMNNGNDFISRWSRTFTNLFHISLRRESR